MENKNSKTLILIGCLAFLITAVITNGFGLLNREATNQELDNKEFITIPISEASENARWYESGRYGRFFVVKADDGTIKTAFDRCDVCYAAGKGYRQEGSDLVCNNCGLRFAINGLGTENKTPGGCWPSYLPHTLESDNIIIRVSDLVNSVREEEFSNEINQQGGSLDLREECDLETGVCFVL